MTLVRTFAVIAALSLAGTSLSQSLGIGSRAPGLTVDTKWVKGTAVNPQAKGVYVVEFWATWCGPCRESIPHLSSLAKKYAGKVKVVGVSVWESKPADYTTAVPKFVKEMGTKMGYSVATDSRGTVAKNWMQAAGERGIPAAFIVKNGVIQWIGHPAALDTPLAEVVAGKFNLGQAKAARAEQARAMAAEMERQKKMAALVEPIQKAAVAKDFEKVIELCDAAIAKNPELEEDLTGFKLMTMVQSAHPDLGNALLATHQGKLGKNLTFMNTVVWEVLVAENRQSEEAYTTCVTIGEEWLKGRIPYELRDTVALAYYKTSNRARALELQTQVIAEAKAAKVPASVMEDLMSRYKLYGGKS